MQNAPRHLAKSANPGRVTVKKLDRRVRRLRRVTTLGVVAALSTIGIVIGISASTAALASPYTVSNATIQTSKGTPTTASGTQVAMWSNLSTATITLSGSGLLLFGAIADICDGYPLVAVTVDGKDVGTETITTTTYYGWHQTRTPVAAGRHTVKFAFVNDHRSGSCDRNVYLGDSKFQSDGTTTSTTTTTTSTSTSTAAAKPPTSTGAQGRSGSNTGVPAGTKLQVHNGDLYVKDDNTVIDGLDIRGFVRIYADNVTIKNSFIRGGIGGPTNLALLANYWGAKNLTVTDTTLAASTPSYYIDGIKGGNMTLERVNVYDVVDSIQIIGGNTTVRDSYLHGNKHFVPDPLQPDGKSHDDNVQIQSGSNILLTGNSFSGAFNSGVMITQDGGKVSNVQITKNYLSGGACTVNVSQQGAGTPFQGMSITDNVFDDSRYRRTCPMLIPRSSPITVSGNTWQGTGAPATPGYR
jgi:hypothetical protein